VHHSTTFTHSVRVQHTTAQLGRELAASRCYLAAETYYASYPQTCHSLKASILKKRGK